MGLMVSDLDQCDQDRLELARTKIVLKKTDQELSDEHTRYISVKSELSRLQNYNDSLVQQNLYLNVDKTKENTKLRKSRNWWVFTAVAAVVTSVAVHYHWKYAEAK